MGGAAVTPQLTSVIIPTFNHAAFLPDAIRSALAQDCPVEVIVVDDGSTDGTAAMVRESFPNVRLIELPHGGPSMARNAGLDAAQGEFVQFLDADDVLDPRKLAVQIGHMTPDVGFVICDVRVEHNRHAQLASERYGYKRKDMGGWLAPQLAAANFIPNMAPLIRRSVIGDLRFHPKREPEDWHFIHAVAERARCRYVDRVLATYRKQLHGRNNSRKRAPWLRPGVVPPTRLNLGCGDPTNASWHPMPGFVNLDKSLGWSFEDGLGEFIDGTVDGITVSHSLMYVLPEDWPEVMREFARVLRPGGVVRITEDDTEHPGSRTYGKGWQGSQPAKILTGPAMVRRYLEGAGFTVHDVDERTTHYTDGSLMQAQHGPRPDVFFIEGVRGAAVLFEPHADDAALFASFAIIRHCPRVVTCFPSAGDYGDTWVRAAETAEAVKVLGGRGTEQWDGTELAAKMRELDARIRPTRVFAPSEDASHPDHVAVAVAAASVFGDRLVKFHTYNADGKVRRGTLAHFDPTWLDLKEQALACYRTQLAHPRARVFFEADLAEYIDA